MKEVALTDDGGTAAVGSSMVGRRTGLTVGMTILLAFNDARICSPTSLELMVNVTQEGSSDSWLPSETNFTEADASTISSSKKLVAIWSGSPLSSIS